MRINIVRLTAGLVWTVAAISASAQDKAGDTREISKTEVPPKLIKMEPPEYPFGQSKLGLIGNVLVEFTIDFDGRVQNPFVVESNNPMFERPALDAIGRWEFKPGLKNGHPVNTRAQQLLVFKLDREEGRVPWRIEKNRNQSSLPFELQWDEAPVPIKTAFPVYPLAALQAEVKGQTRLNFIIGPEGRVIKAKVTKTTTPEMELAVLAMIDAWQFTPARKKDGTPAYAEISIEHEFNPYGGGDVPVANTARDILRLLKKHPERIMAADKLDQPPKPVSQRPPVYPTALREVGQPGEAVVEFFIDEDGDAQLPSIVSSSSPQFGYAAVQAVATWRFAVPMAKRKPVVVRVRIPVEFKHAKADSTNIQLP